MKADEFISDEEIRETLSYAEKNKDNIELIDSIIEKAKLRKGLNHREASVLLACENQEKLDEVYALAEQIKKDFNSVENLEKEILNESLKLKGSGYVNLVLDNNKLRIILTSNEDIPEYYGFKTLMTIDLWEHAYITMYELDRYTYVKRLLEHINYEYISKIYEEKKQK